MVRSWQSIEDRTFPVHPDAGDTIRIEFQQTQSDGASVDIYRPSPLESANPLARIGPSSDDRTPTSPIEFDVEEGGKHSVLVHPCCAIGSGTFRAWVRIYVE